MSLNTITENEIYTQIAEEMERNEKKTGLWTKATAFAEGEPEKIKALYIKYRFQSIQEEIIKREEDEVRNRNEILKEKQVAAINELQKDQKKSDELSETEKQEHLKKVRELEDDFLLSIKGISKNTNRGQEYMVLFHIRHQPGGGLLNEKFIHGHNYSDSLELAIKYTLKKMNVIAKLKILKFIKVQKMSEKDQTDKDQTEKDLKEIEKIASKKFNPIVIGLIGLGVSILVKLLLKD